MPKRVQILPCVRAGVYDRDGAACVFCGSTADLHLDHVVPWSLGGCDDSSNLRPLCARCNLQRSTRQTPDDASTRPPVATRCTACSPSVDPDAWGWCRSCHDYGEVSELDIDGCPDPSQCRCGVIRQIIARSAGRAARRERRRAYRSARRGGDA